MTKDRTDVKCPICGAVKKRKGLFFHFRNNHAKEFNELGYSGIMATASSAEAEPEVRSESAKKETVTQPTPKKVPRPAIGKKIDRKFGQDITDDSEEDLALEAWNRISKQKIWFNPSPSGAAMINEFGNVSNPSDIINKALIEYGKNRGIQHAIFKTEGGKALTLVGDKNDDGSDREFNRQIERMLKIMQVNAAQNQSYGQYSPTVLMMQMMKDKVSGGMSMGDFMKDLMKMKMQQMISQRPQTNPLMWYVMMNRRKGRR